MKLSKLIAKTYPDLSYNRIQKLIRERQIKVEGVRVARDVVLRSAHVEVYIPEMDFTAVYEDENVLVIDKPRGVPSTGKTSVDSHYKALGYSICHRLDTNTRGLLIVAKNDTAMKAVMRAFKTHSIEKYYKALVYGTLTTSEKLIAYAVKDSENGYLKVYKDPRPGAVEIVTSYRVLGYEGDNTWLEVCLHTGKTHQIRAHLAFIGHFILGDDKYGNEDLNKKLGYSKQQLTAERIVFHFGNRSVLSYLDGTEVKLK